MILNPQKIAILLATYNGAKYIEEQARSISSQVHQQWHVFVRDDGSTDQTLEILRSIIPQEQITVIDPKLGIGGSPAKNFFSILDAIDLDNFAFIAFCDQDDIWSPRKLSRAVKCLEQATTDGYSSNLIPFDYTKKNAWWLSKSQPEKKFDYLFQGASAGCTYVLTNRAAKLVQARVKSILTAPPPRFSHDWTIYAICRSFGLGWYQDSEAHIFYRQHSANSFGALPSFGGLLARFELARSGWYRQHVTWLAGFLSGSSEEKDIVEKISRFTLIDRMWLVWNAGKFRRRPRDTFLFALALACGAL